MIHLTKQDTPARPVVVNPQYVTSIQPLRKTLPSPNSQTPGQVQIAYSGTKLTLSDGTFLNVVEDYDSVINLLAPPTWEQTSAVGNAGDVVEAENSGVEPEPVKADAEGTFERDLGAGLLDASQIPTIDFSTKLEPGVYTEAGHQSADHLGTTVNDPSGDSPLPTGDFAPAEPPAGTPLTEEELAQVAAHDAIPDEERPDQPEQLSAAEKRKRTLEAKKAAQGKGDE